MQAYKSRKELNETQKAVDAFLATKPGFSFNAFYCGEQKREDWVHDAWQIRIGTNAANVQTFDYCTGTGHREKKPGARPAPTCGKRTIAYADWERNNIMPVFPHVANVLYSLILEAGARNECFQDWCDNFGYNSDSIKAQSIYNACIENAFKLAKVFTGSDLKTLAELLQDY